MSTGGFIDPFEDFSDVVRNSAGLNQKESKKIYVVIR